MSSDGADGIQLIERGERFHQGCETGLRGSQSRSGREVVLRCDVNVKLGTLKVVRSERGNRRDQFFIRTCQCQLVFLHSQCRSRTAVPGEGNTDPDLNASKVYLQSISSMTATGKSPNLEIVKARTRSEDLSKSTGLIEGGF